jgi:hypothetical protein
MVGNYLKLSEFVKAVVEIWLRGDSGNIVSQVRVNLEESEVSTYLLSAWHISLIHYSSSTCKYRSSPLDFSQNSNSYYC